MKAIIGAGMLLVALAGQARAQAPLYSGGGTFGVIQNSFGFSAAPVAAPFYLSQPSTLTAVRIPFDIYGCTGAPCGLSSLTFSWALYADGGANLPGVSIASGTAQPTPTVTYADPWREAGYWTVPLPGVVTAHSGQFWFAATNDLPGNDHGPVIMTWLTYLNVTVPPGALFNAAAQTWSSLPPLDDITSSYGNRLGIDVIGTTTVPEPSVVMLLGSGLLCLVPVVRSPRRRR